MSFSQTTPGFIENDVAKNSSLIYAFHVVQEYRMCNIIIVVLHVLGGVVAPVVVVV